MCFASEYISLNLYLCDAEVLSIERQLKPLGNALVPGKLKPPKKNI